MSKTEGLGETEYILFQPPDNKKPVLMEVPGDEQPSEIMIET